MHFGAVNHDADYPGKERRDAANLSQALRRTLLSISSPAAPSENREFLGQALLPQYAAVPRHDQNSHQGGLAVQAVGRLPGRTAGHQRTSQAKRSAQGSCRPHPGGSPQFQHGIRGQGSRVANRSDPTRTCATVVEATPALCGGRCCSPQHPLLKWNSGDRHCRLPNRPLPLRPRMSKKLKHPAVGIDLGTTYSAIAQLDDTGPARDAGQRRGRPDHAQRRAVRRDQRRGRQGSGQGAGDRGRAGRRVRQARPGQPRSITSRSAAGSYPPEAMQAWMLNKLRSDAERQIGDFSKVVITVPAYFDEVRRKATQDAGYMAGLEVLDIINEPTAAALAFGFQQGFLNPQGEASEPQKILVYDLGGGTFDVTVMEIGGTRFQRPGHRRRRAAGRPGLGPAAGRLRGRGVHPQARRRSARGSQHRRPAVARVRRRQADALGPARRRSIACDYQGPRRARRSHAREVRGDDARPARPHRASPRGRRCKPPAWTGTTSTACCWSAARRRMPMVARHAARAVGQGAGWLGLGRRGRGPRRGAARRADPGAARRARRRRSAFSNVNSHSLGVVATDAKTGRQAQRDPDSPQHAAAGHGQARLQHAEGRPAVDPGADRRRRKPLARRLLADRQLRGPRPAAGPAGADADRSAFPLRRERPADRARCSVDRHRQAS